MFRFNFTEIRYKSSHNHFIFQSYNSEIRENLEIARSPSVVGMDAADLRMEMSLAPQRLVVLVCAPAHSECLDSPPRVLLDGSEQILMLLQCFALE